MEDKIIRIQAAVDELTDIFQKELEEVLQYLRNGEEEKATEKVLAMLKSITREE